MIRITEIQKIISISVKPFLLVFIVLNPPFYKFETTFIIGIIIEIYTTTTNVATKP